MNIQGGGLHFEISGTNKQLLQVINESKKAIQTFSTDSVAGGKNVDQSFTAAANAINRGFRQIDAIVDANKAAISQLKAKYEELGIALETAYNTPGGEKEMYNIRQRQKELEKEIRLREKIISDAGEQADALLKEEQILNERKAALDDINNKHETIRTQLRKAKEELMQMAAAGQRGTDAYTQQQQKVAQLTASMKAANKQASVLANPNKVFSGVVGGLTLMTSGYQAVTGAMGLFAGENENLQRIMVKVQSLMSITMALQTAYTQLNKNSAFQLVIVAKAKDMLTAANARLAAALGVSTAAATAFMAAITLGLSVAITGVIYLISKFSKKADEATVATGAMRKAFEDYHATTAQQSANLVSKFAELRFEYLSLKTEAEKTEWIKQNQKEFGGLELAVNGVSDADNIFIDNTPKVIKALELRAKAMALQELQAKAYEAYYTKLVNADSTVKGGGFYRNMKAGTRIKPGSQEAKDLAAAMKAAGAVIKNGDAYNDGTSYKMVKGQIELSKKGADEINAYYIQEARKTNKKIHEQAQKELSNTSKMFEREQTKINKEQAKLNILQKQKPKEEHPKPKKEAKNTQKDAYAEELEEKKRMYKEYLAQVTSEDKIARDSAAERFKELLAGGASYIDYLEKQRAALMAKTKQTAEDLRRITMLNKEIAENTKQTVLSDFETQLNKEMQAASTLSQQLAVIEKKRAELKNNNSDVDNSKKDILRNVEEATRKQATDDTEKAIQQYASFTNERIKFEESYARTRELLLAKINAKKLDTQDSEIKKLLELKSQYEQYAKEAESSDKAVAANAKKRWADTLKHGNTFIEALQNEINKLEDPQIKLGLKPEEVQRLEKLKKVLETETTPDSMVAAAIAALAALEKKRKEYAKQSDSELYDEMLKQYKTYQQQQTDIHEKYTEQRAEAERHGNSLMIADINAQEQAELSKLAASKLMASDSWNQLFSDITTLSNKAINKLIANVNSQKVTLSAEFNPADLKAINDQLERAKDELHKRNPFLALRDSLANLRTAMKAKKIFNEDSDFGKELRDKKQQYEAYTKEIESGDETVANSAAQRYAALLQQGATFTDYLKRRIAELQNKKINMQLDTNGEEELEKLTAALRYTQGESEDTGKATREVFNSIARSISDVRSGFDSVVGGMKKMGIQMDEETETILNDLGSMMDGASQLASGLASGDALSVIQGSINLFSSAFDMFNTRDRKAEKSIKRHEQAVNRLSKAYTQLKWEVDKALGETQYQNQTALIRNLQAQQAEIRAMINDESRKKKKDKDRIGEWQEQLADAKRQISDIMDEITTSITQTSAADMANNFADAWVEAFGNVKDAAKVSADVANDVMRNAVKNALKVKFLQEPLQRAIKQLQHDMGFNDDGLGTFDGLTQQEQARFKDAVAKAGANFQQAMDAYKGLFAQLDDSDPGTLSGAIKGASQESIDLLSGQTNAVRVNQVVALDVMRDQLTRITAIDGNVVAIAQRLLTIVNKLTTPADDGLRGQGIIS